MLTNKFNTKIDLMIHVKFDDDLPNGPYAMQSKVAPGEFDVFLPAYGAKLFDVKQAMENFAKKDLTRQPELTYSKVTAEWTLEEISYKGGVVSFDSEAKEETYQAFAIQRTKIKHSKCLLCTLV